MKNELEKFTEQWMQLERKTLEQRKEADAFYDENLMKPIEKEFIRKNKSKVRGKTDYLIISVGTSYEPLVLSISLFNPKRILFLYTPVTEEVLNKIVSYCGLDMTGFQKSLVHETNPMDIYREIKRAYLAWGRPQKLYIDFTGGTKAMSAAAAMAGAVIDMQMVYVGTDRYLPDFRKPYPGSETLFYIDNPLAVFGDLEVEKVMALFRQCNYAGAREKLETFKDQIPEPELRQQLDFAYLLAVMYEHWDALEFVPAFEAAGRLEMELRRDMRIHGDYLLMDFMGRIERQRNILEELKEIPALLRAGDQFGVLGNGRLILPLMFTMHSCALLRERQGKYDMATLLLYRLLEMVEQRRLAGYNLFVSRMVYEDVVFKALGQEHLNTLLGPDKREWLKDAAFEIRKKLFPKTENRFLPEQISLLEGFILLAVLRDEIFETGKPPVIQLKKIRSMVHLRNNSIFAHGLGPVSKEDYLKFRAFVEGIFRAFCVAESVDYEEWVSDMEFIDPTQSIYYSKVKV